MKRTALTAAYFLFFVSIISSCRKPKDDNGEIGSQSTPRDSIFLFVDEVMKELYLWNDKISHVDMRDYSDPDKQMTDMAYQPLDRWSHVYKKSELESFFTGESVSYGFQPVWYGDVLTVAMVYKKSEAYLKGMRRGDKILQINNQQPTLINDFGFLSNPTQGETLSLTLTSAAGDRDITISAADVTADQIMHHAVLGLGEKKAGYIVYESFTENTKDSLLAVMEDFRIQGATELIIDLRYNGGGEVSVLIDWMSKILPPRFAGKPFFVTKHNKMQSSYNEISSIYPDATSLSVERVFVISSQYTASASEALINGLKPYIEVHQIGERSHGKPVGMYVLEFNDWYVVPISFEYTNAVGGGGFYAGIEPEQYAYDDVSCAWGSLYDPALAQAVHYIRNGNYSNTVIASRLKSSKEPLSPVREIGLYVKKTFPIQPAIK